VRFERSWRIAEKCVLFLAASAVIWGQGPGQPGPRPPGQGPGPARRDGPAPGPFQMAGPRPQQFGGPGGKWWGNPELVKRLSITAEQVKKMDDLLQQSRLKLIDLNATLEKEEVMMEGLMRGPQLDDAKILPAVDRIAQARAELEKANARLMLGIRHVLTPEQWEKLQSETRPHRVGPGPIRGGPNVDGPAPKPARGPNGPPPQGGPGGPAPQPAHAPGAPPDEQG